METAPAPLPSPSISVVGRIKMALDGEGRTVLNNRYTFLAHLGSGSFAEVVVARDNSCGELVAVKIFSKSRLMKKRELGKLQNEILVMQKLQETPTSSPAPIVRLRSVIAQASVDDMFLVLEYCDAGPLMNFDAHARRYRFEASVSAVETANEASARWINDGIQRSGGSLPAVLVAQLMRDLLSALASSHSTTSSGGGGGSVAHRDVKPENCLLDSASGKLLLADFGVAKSFGDRDIGDESDSEDNYEEEHAGVETGTAMETQKELGERSTKEKEGTEGLSRAGRVPCEHVSAALVKDTAGSPLFLPPEACKGSLEEGREEGAPSSSGGGYCAYCADAFSSGVLMYCLLFGSLPFGAAASAAAAGEGVAGEGGRWFNALAVFEALANAALPERDEELPWTSSFYGRWPFDKSEGEDREAEAEAEAGEDRVLLTPCLAVLRGLLQPEPGRRLTAASACRILSSPPFAATTSRRAFRFAAKDITALRPYKNLALELLAPPTPPPPSAASSAAALSPSHPLGSSSAVGAGSRGPSEVFLLPSSPSSPAAAGKHDSSSSTRSETTALRSPDASSIYRSARGSKFGAALKELFKWPSSPSSVASPSSSSRSLHRSSSRFSSWSASSGAAAVSEDAAPGGERGDSEDSASPSAPVILRGWLHKRGRVWKGWRRRFFVLQGEQLRYYKADPATSAGPSASASSSSSSPLLRGMVDVSKLIRVLSGTAEKADVASAAVPSGASSASCLFALEVKEDGAAAKGKKVRLLELRADNEDDKARWMRAIEALRAGLAGLSC